MGKMRVVLVVTFLGLLAFAPGRAWALDYELWVANLLESSLLAYLQTQRLASSEDDRLDRLASALDRGGVPQSAYVPDRQISPIAGRLASAFGSSPLSPTLSPSSPENGWHQFRWDGPPGKLAVFEVKGSGLHWQELRHAGVSLDDSFKVIPIRIPPLRGPALLPGLETSSVLLDHRIEQGNVGAWLRRSLDLREGIGVVVARNSDPAASDRVYVVMLMTDTARRFKVALGWRERRAVPQGGGAGSVLPGMGPGK